MRYLVIFLLIALACSKKLDPKRIIYAVDAGSTQGGRSFQGFYYQPDRGYSDNTKVADYHTNAEAAAATIKYTREGGIYLTERHADDTFYYDIPVSQNGKYVVISKLCENWHRQSRQRVFNIDIGKCHGETGIDVFDRVGRFAAYDSYVEVELRNNGVYVDGQYCADAYHNGKIRVYYTKIGIDNPMVDAVLLFQGDLSETDYSDQDRIRKEWDQLMKNESRRKEEERIRKEEARLKRRERVKPRNDEYEDFGDDYEDGDFNFTASRSLGDYISDYLGLGLVLLIGAAIVYFLAGKGESGPISFEPASSQRESAATGDKAKKEKQDKTQKKSKAN